MINYANKPKILRHWHSMKNSDTNELQQIYIRDAHYSTRDEISIVDFVTVLVKNKNMLILSTIILFSLGVTISVFIPKSYTYTTSIEVGSRIIDGVIQPFESPETLLAKMQYVHIPQALNELHPKQNKESRYKTTANIPKNSNIIVVEAKGTENDHDILIKYLQNMTTKAVQDSQLDINAIKTDIIVSKERAIDELNLLNNSSNTSEEKKNTLKNEIKAYETEIANLRNTRVILRPMKSIDSTETNNTLIILTLAFVSVFLGVLSVLLVEFIRKVKSNLT